MIFGHSSCDLCHGRGLDLRVSPRTPCFRRNQDLRKDFFEELPLLCRILPKDTLHPNKILVSPYSQE